MRTTWKPFSNKTKLTFLLALTFLFLFSGSVYGGVIDETFDDVFDRKGEVVGIYCNNNKKYVSINMKEKTIKVYSRENRLLQDTYKIIRETGIYIMGEDKTTSSNLFIDRHQNYFKGHIRVYYRDKGNNKKNDFYGCVVGDKVF